MAQTTFRLSPVRYIAPGPTLLKQPCAKWANSLTCLSAHLIVNSLIWQADQDFNDYRHRLRVLPSAKVHPQPHRDVGGKSSGGKIPSFCYFHIHLLKYYNCNLQIMRRFYYVIVGEKVPEVKYHLFLTFIFIFKILRLLQITEDFTMSLSVEKSSWGKIPSSS